MQTLVHGPVRRVQTDVVRGSADEGGLRLAGASCERLVWRRAIAALYRKADMDRIRSFALLVPGVERRNISAAMWNKFDHRAPGGAVRRRPSGEAAVTEGMLADLPALHLVENAYSGIGCRTASGSGSNPEAC